MKRRSEKRRKKKDGRRKETGESLFLLLPKVPATCKMYLRDRSA